MPAMKITVAPMVQRRVFSAYGSAVARSESAGSAATAVSEPPKGTFIFALAFTAQPLALRIGPMLRSRSLRYAISIEGKRSAA